MRTAGRSGGAVSHVQCPCCKGGEVLHFVTYKNLPEILFPVDADAWKAISCADLPLFSCAMCGHIFQQEVDQARLDRIYHELYRFYPYNNLESFSTPYRVPFEAAFELISNDSSGGKRLLEIGCSSPESMKKFLKKGYQCTGVDPSSKSSSHGPIEVIGERYERVRFNEPFDAIVLRFVLEHIVDLEELLSRISEDLRDGGRIFVQVPNIHQWMKGGTLCVGAHEHTQYFTIESLLALFGRFGYELVYQNGARMPSIIACFSKTKIRAWKDYPEFQAILRASDDQIIDLLKPFRTLCFYGAGLQLMWLLYSSHFDARGKTLYVIDDNDVITGRFLPALGVPVRRVSSEIVAQSDAVVLTLNSIYHQSAMGKLQDVCSSEKTVLLNEGAGWKVTRIFPKVVKEREK